LPEADLMGFLKDGRVTCAFGILAALVMGWSTVAGGEDLEVRLRNHVSVKGASLYLGEAASFDPDHDDRVEGLRGIVLASTPSPGRTMILSSRYLVSTLTAALPETTDIRFKLPEAMSVHREARVVSVDEMTEIFKQHVLKNTSWPEASLHFDSVRVSGPVSLPPGDLSWEVKDRGNTDYLVDVALVICFLADGTMVRKVPVSGKVSLERPVVRTTRNIEAGRILEEQDLTVVKEQRFDSGKDLLTDTGEAAGKRALRSLDAGQLVERKMLDDPPLVKKGERVRIEARSAGGLADQIRVTALGRVLQDGRAGEQVKVMNLMSGKEIHATVTGVGAVAVSF
jgi:flagella basal body P-ring formation protein FlgA